MAVERAYLDHNATTPLRPAAAQAMVLALGMTGNPSSIHADGRLARAAIDKARMQVAAAVRGEAKNVIFTSGATEGLNTLLRPSPAIVSGADGRRIERLLILATEHSAALSGHGFEPDQTETVPVDGDGVIDLAILHDRLASLADTDGFAPVMIAAQLANSESGVIQPVAEIAALARRFHALLVCDCVAAFGKIAVDVAALGADAIVISAHKFGGPRGAAAIILHGDRLQLQKPLLSGGGQEMRRRSGTENGPAIIGMGVAATEAAAHIDAEAGRMRVLRDRLIEAFRAQRPDLTIFGGNAPRLPHVFTIGLPGLRAETAVIAFDLASVSVSSGSACSSGKVKRSHVLEAMGVDRELAESAIRFSLGWTTQEQDIALAIRAFAKVAGQSGGRRAA